LCYEELEGKQLEFGLASSCISYQDYIPDFVCSKYLFDIYPLVIALHWYKIINDLDMFENDKWKNCLEKLFEINMYT